MSASQTNDVNQELVTPVEEQASLPESSQQEVSQEPRPGSQEYNFKEMRRILEEQQRKIRELESQQYSRAPTQQHQDEDDISALRPDDYVTRAQMEKLALKKAEELLYQREVETQEERARQRFNDYDSVVSQENVDELLKDKDVAATLRGAPDPYTAAYKLIKNSAAFSQKQQFAQRRAAEAQRIEKNLTKPASSNSVTSKAISEANSFTVMNDDVKKQLWAEMNHFAKSR